MAIDFKELVGKRILVEKPKIIGIGDIPIDVEVVEVNDVCSHVLLIYCGSDDRHWHAISDLAKWTLISVLQPIKTKLQSLDECKKRT